MREKNAIVLLVLAIQQKLSNVNKTMRYNIGSMVGTSLDYPVYVETNNHSPRILKQERRERKEKKPAWSFVEKSSGMNSIRHTGLIWSFIPLYTQPASAV